MPEQMPTAAAALESPALCLIEEGTTAEQMPRGVRHALVERFVAGDRKVRGAVTGLSLDPETTEYVSERMPMIAHRVESSGGLRLWLAVPRSTATAMLERELTDDQAPAAPDPPRDPIRQPAPRRQAEAAGRLVAVAEALERDDEEAAVRAAESIVPVDEFCRIAPAVHLRAARVAHHSIAALVEAIRSGDHGRRSMAQGMRDLAMIRQAAWHR